MSVSASMKRVCAAVTYDPKAGTLHVGKRLVKGTQLANGGQLVFNYKGRRFMFARVCYAKYHGYLPPILRHFDRDPRNNAIDNLYPAQDPKYFDLLHATAYPYVSEVVCKRTKVLLGYRGTVFLGRRQHRTTVVETPEEARDLRAALKEWLEWVESQKGTAQ